LRTTAPIVQATGEIRENSLSGRQLKQLKKDAASVPVVVLSSLSEKNRQKLIEAGAEDYLEKSSVAPSQEPTCLPKLLEDVIYRINRKNAV